MKLNDVWHPDNPRPGASDADLDHADAMLGVTLPLRYRALLKLHNGGETRKMRFRATLPAPFGADYLLIDHFHGVGRAAVDVAGPTVLGSYKIAEEHGLPRKQILLHAGAHWFVSLDYRKHVKAPRVHLFDVQDASDQPLAPDFDAFLKALRPTTATDR